jgi:phosphosulfolactate phosphohydrolase-like enzyme
MRDKVCMVVDVIRASSAIVTLLEGGVSRVIPTRSLDLARQLAGEHGWVLAGESNGIAPPDFDYSNSPVQLAKAGLAGKVVGPAMASPPSWKKRAALILSASTTPAVSAITAPARCAG